MTEELIEIENRIRGALAGEPSMVLRQRVLWAVDAELANDRRSASAEMGWLWPAIAAAVLIVMNLSFISASRDAFSLGPPPHGQDFAAEIHAIQSITSQQEGLFK